MRYILLLLIATLILGSCQKPNNGPSSNEIAEEKLQKDAAFNDAITPGVGNVFYEDKLVPNSTSQLIFKMGFNGDTLAAYGKINSTGQLQYINTSVLSTKGNSELLVNEVFPEVSKSRMYTILNNVKSNIIIEINHYSKTKLTVSILDMDWATGKSKILKSTYFVDDKVTSSFSLIRTANEGGNMVYNCLEPPPTSDIEKAVDDLLNYFACGGPAFDTYPTLIPIKNLFSEYIEYLNQNPQYSNDKDELNLFQKSYKYMNDLFSKIKNKVGGYKFEKSRLSGYLKKLESEINKLLPQNNPEVSLVPFAAGTDIDYDEVTDNEIKLSFILKDKSTGLPYTSRPVFIDMSFTIPGTNTEVYWETKATGVSNGLVTFKFDPTTITNYQNLTSLKATYSFSGDLGTPNESQIISLKFIKPKVVFANGNSLPATVKFAKNQSQNFKLVNEDNRDIVVNYNDVTLNNLNNKVGYTMLKGTNDFTLSLTTNETTEQLTQLEVIYKQKKISTINASINMDSTAIYAASIVGNWQIDSYAGGVLYYVQQKILTQNGEVFIVKNSPVGGVEESFSPPRFQEGWAVVKNNSGYHLAIDGRVYEYVLTYPVTFINGGFPPYPNYVYTKK